MRHAALDEVLCCCPGDYKHSLALETQYIIGSPVILARSLQTCSNLRLKSTLNLTHKRKHTIRPQHTDGATRHAIPTPLFPNGRARTLSCADRLRPKVSRLGF